MTNNALPRRFSIFHRKGRHAESKWQPMTEAESRENWIAGVLDMVEIEKRGGDDHRASHYTFCRKVLGEPKQDALAIAYHFRDVQLTRESCDLMVADWERCDICKADVPGGTKLCATCAEELQEAA